MQAIKQMINIHMTPKDIENNDIYHYLYRGWIFISYKKKRVFCSLKRVGVKTKNQKGPHDAQIAGLWRA
jgi:hypothetical protein